MSELFGLDTSEWKNMVQRLVNSPATPPLVLAKTHEMMAEYVKHTSNLGALESYETRAITIFEDDHAHDALEIRLRQASRCTAGSERGSQDEGLQQIVDYLSEFEKQGYLYGRVLALTLLINEIPDIHHFNFQLLDVIRNISALAD